MDKYLEKIPKDYISVRVTTDNFDNVCSVFEGTSCVISGQEISKEGVKHYHAVVLGHACYECIGKRLQRLNLGPAKYWRKKNHGKGFLESISYTIKCGEYYTRNGFEKWVSMAPEFKPKDEYFEDIVEKIDSNGKDQAKSWMFTYSNILKVAYNFRNRHNMETKQLGDVLSSMSEEGKWIPSPQMVRCGLENWYFRHFEWMCSNHQEPPPPWWKSQPLGRF